MYWALVDGIKFDLNSNFLNERDTNTLNRIVLTFDIDDVEHRISLQDYKRWITFNTIQIKPQSMNELPEYADKKVRWMESTSWCTLLENNTYEWLALKAFAMHGIHCCDRTTHSMISYL